MTKRELMEKIGGEEGTVEEAEQWLTQLQEMDLYFWQSDRMLQLAESVRTRRRAQAIRSGMDAPPSPAQIASLLDSIDYGKAAGRGDLEELEAREAVIGGIFPHPDTMRYLSGLLSEGTPIEAAVEAALSYRPVATFHMPGPVDADWQVGATGEPSS